jgi:hypothetical protein
LSGPVAVLVVAALVVVAHSLAEQSSAHTNAPPAVVAVLLGLAAFDLARYDHGLGDAVFAVAWVGAPVAAIFAGALWGTRRLYGWPDLGPLPGRVAASAVAILVGFFIGTRIADIHDIPESKRIAEGLRNRVVSWRSDNAGQWPDSLDDAGFREVKSAMGTVMPPPIGYEREGGGAVLVVPLSRGKRLVLDLETGSWSGGPEP